MRTFYYAHTGHRIGLDRFRRAAAVINMFPDHEITLLTSDFRIAGSANEYGIEKAIGLDVVRNIANIAEHGDRIIFDSEEFNDALLADMINYFSTFVRFSENADDVPHGKEFLINPFLKESDQVCNALAVGEHYFEEKPKRLKRVFFYGDDDYNEKLLEYQTCFKDLGFSLLEGFYYFLDYSKKLSGSFEEFFESEAYDDVIKSSDIFVSSSPQACLEASAGGAKVLYIQRTVYANYPLALFEKLGILTLDGFDRDKIKEKIAQLEQGDSKKLLKDDRIKQFLSKVMFS